MTRFLSLYIYVYIIKVMSLLHIYILVYIKREYQLVLICFLLYKSFGQFDIQLDQWTLKHVILKTMGWCDCEILLYEMFLLLIASWQNYHHPDGKLQTRSAFTLPDCAAWWTCSMKNVQILICFYFETVFLWHDCHPHDCCKTYEF